MKKYLSSWLSYSFPAVCYQTKNPFVSVLKERPSTMDFSAVASRDHPVSAKSRHKPHVPDTERKKPRLSCAARRHVDVPLCFVPPGKSTPSSETSERAPSAKRDSSLSSSGDKSSSDSKATQVPTRLAHFQQDASGIAVSSLSSARTVNKLGMSTMNPYPFIFD